MIRIISFKGLIVGFLVLLAPIALAQERRPHSILVLDEAETRGPFYDLIFSGLREVVGAHPGSRVTLYGENLDLNRFDGPACGQASNGTCTRSIRARQSASSRIILAHWGRIWAENQTGGGAAFHFTLPLAV